MEASLIDKYYNHLSKKIFFAKEHQLLFQIIWEQYDKHQALDLAILGNILVSKGLNQLYAYTIEMVNGYMYSPHFEFHLMMLVQFSVKRDFIEKFSLLLKCAQNQEEDIFALREKAFNYFDNLFLYKELI